MRIIRVANAKEGGRKVFELIEGDINNGAKVLGLVTGSTPKTLYKEITASDVDFTGMTSVNLDKYVGLGDEDERSYRCFMNKHLFDKRPFEETFVPNGKAEGLDATSAEYEKIIDTHPIDVQVLGIGQDGHIGSDESGTPLDSLTHVIELVESTINADKRYFNKVEDVPTRAVSMGIGSIMKGKRIILVAYDKAKAETIKGMTNGPVTVDMSTGALQNHQDVVVITDDAATSKL